MSEEKKYTDSGIEINKVYDAHAASYSPMNEKPGEAPFTRGTAPEGLCPLCRCRWRAGRRYHPEKLCSAVYCAAFYLAVS